MHIERRKCMKLKNANATIKELRRRVGATQEEFSENICSPQSLSRIETGKGGVSYKTLKKFMEKAGVNSDVYPAFSDKRDCDIHRKLYLCQRYIDVWMLEEAAQVLREVADLQYGENQLYYQQCLCYKGLILLKSGRGNEKEINDVLERAIRITTPEYHPARIATYGLSNTEMRLLLALSYSYLLIGEVGSCDEIVTAMESFLDKLNTEESLVLKVKSGVIRACSSMKKGQFMQAEKLLKRCQMLVVNHKIYSQIQLILFLQGICQINTGNAAKGRETVLNCYYSAKAMGSSFADSIFSYVQKEIPDSNVKQEMEKDYNVVLPPMEPIIVNEDRNHNNKHPYYLGNLVRDERMEKGIRQSVLCKGLCSKSTLSKIENNILIPELEIMESLLQRLGIYTGAFEMYANLKTYSFFELQHALSAVVVETPKEKADRLFDLLLKSVNEKSAVQRQYVLYTWGMLEQDSSKKQFLLREALYQTQPDFHITYIQDSVLTFQEMMILIYIAKSLKNDTTKSILILYKLMEYFQVWNYENLEKVRIQKEIILVLSELLLSDKRLKEMKELGKYIEKLPLTGDYQSLSQIYETMYQGLSALEPCKTNNVTSRYRKAFQHIFKIS